MTGGFHALLIDAVVGLGLMGLDQAVAFAVLVYAIQILVPLLISVWGFRQLDIRFGELLSSIRIRDMAGAYEALE